MLHPQEVALLQTLVRSGKLTAETARAFAQGLETRRAAGEKPNLVEALVARRIASPEEIAGALRQTAAKTAAVALGPPTAWLQKPPPPVIPDPDSPTVRTGSGPDSLIRPPKRHSDPPIGTDGPGFTERYPARPVAPTRPVMYSPAGPAYDSSAPRGWAAPGPPPNEAPTLGDPSAFGGPPSPAPAAGGGPFALETRISDGTIGEVWRARHAAQRRTLAVKILRTATLAPAELDRILAEARAAMKAKHPNIVSVHQIGTLPDGRPFIAMDFIDGPSLANTLESRTLGAAEVARIGAKIAAALQAAHEQGVVHGDVRPQNILLDERSEPFIADFGLAREEEEGSLRFRGTPGYVAPEQVCATPIPSPASDIYSLGATLYHCLTRKAPFSANTPMATAKLALKGKPTRPTKIEPTVPPELEAVIMKALEKDPARRYANVGMLGEDLRRFLDGRPLEARPAGGLFAGSSVLVAALAALVVILGGATAVLVVRKVALEKHVKELEDLEAKGDWTELEASARALAQERPDEPRAQRHLAYALAGERKGADAVEAAKQAALLSGDGPEDVVALGAALLANDKPDDARAAFEKVIALKPAPNIEASALAGAACALAWSDAKAGKEKAEKALALLPEDSFVAAVAGRALLLCREPRAALEALKKAAAARPKDESVLTDKAIAVAATGDASGALTDLDTVLAQHADYVPALVARARIKLSNGDNQQAADDADKARNVDASARDAHLVAALALTWLGRFDDAESRVQDLQKLAPTELTTAIARAALSLARGKPEDASAALRDAPTPAKKESGLLATALRALALRAAIRPEEAKNEADQVVRLATAGEASWLAPGDDDSIAQAIVRRYGFSTPESTGHALKAEALYDMQRVPDAKIEVEAAKRATPVAPRAALAEGLCQLSANDVQGALRTADQAIQQSPDLAVLRELRALVKIEMKAPSVALTDIDQAIKLEPANYLPHYLRARVRLQMGDPTSALGELETAERFAPRARPDIFGLHAQLLLNSGRIPEARKMAEKGLVADPRNTDCLYMRGVARCYLGDDRFDEDVKAALQTPQGRGRGDIYVTLYDMLLARGRVAEAEQGTTQLLESLKMQQGGNGQLRIQLLLIRASSRALMPDKWKEGLEDVGVLLDAQPENTAFLSIRGFIVAALGQSGYAEDAKKCANAPQQILQMIFQRGQIAAQSKLQGGWLAFYTALGEATQLKELKAGCWQLVAMAAEADGKPDEAVAALEKANEIAPSDQLRQMIDQLKARKK